MSDKTRYGKALSTIIQRYNKKNKIYFSSDFYLYSPRSLKQQLSASHTLVQRDPTYV